MCKYANTGSLSMGELRGGKPARLKSIDALEMPVCVDPGQVYVPIGIEVPRNKGVLSALSTAIIGEGGSPVSDHPTIDIVTNSVKIES